MCGFAGFSGADEKLIRRMTALLVHRGPDGEGFYTDSQISLGHRRLAILDLTPAGAQPMPNHDKTLWLVYNGEIYNYLELRAELEAKGRRFHSRSDSEVLLQGYEAWGEAMLSRLNGMFAFAIYDARGRTVFLARDRYGIKPLHYHHQGNTFVFASEIKALLAHPQVSRSENPLAIYDYLAFNCYNHTEETFFKSVKVLPPGGSLHYEMDSHQLRFKRWYQLPEGQEDVKEPSLQGAVEEFRTLFFDSIRLRLRTDVEIGSCLSGGLDSSSIVCGVVAGLKTPADRFKTFSAVIQKPGLDESDYMESVIGHAGVQSYKTYPDSAGLLRDFDTLLRAQEEPFGGTSIYAQWEVMKLTKERGIKVLLDGQGADELLAGYPFFFGYYFLELLKSLRIGKFISEANHYASHMKEVLNEGLLTPFFLMAPRTLQSFLWGRIYGNVLNRDFSKKYSSISNIPSLLYEPVDLNEALSRRMRYGLPQLLREEDRNSMAFSVEARLPFLDYRLVHFLLKTPSIFKIHSGKTKYLLRESMKNTVPEKILQRTSKLGFTTPLDEWLRLPAFQDRVRYDLKQSRECLAPYIDFQKMNRLLEGHFSGRLSVGQMVWKLWNLAAWVRSF